MPHPTGLSYHEHFLPPHDQATLLQAIQTLPFTQDRFRGQTLKRSYAQFGYAYVSIGQKLTPAPPFPPFLLDLVAQAAAPLPAPTAFHQCIITHYPPGAGIGWHTDAKAFGDTIIGVSLGANATLQFRPNDSAELLTELTLPPGSLYVMTGPGRWTCQHQLKPVKRDRYALTLRQVPA